jgi:hypothetical protein
LIHTLRSATQEVKDRLAHDGGAKEDDDHKEMVDTILKEVREVVKAHKARSAEWYNEVGSRGSTLHNPVAICILRHHSQLRLSLFGLTKLVGPCSFSLQS